MYAGTSYDIFSVKFIDLNDTVWSNAGLSLPQAKPSFLILDFLNALLCGHISECIKCQNQITSFMSAGMTHIMAVLITCTYNSNSTGKFETIRGKYPTLLEIGL